MAVPVPSGYGPVGASSASVPFFDGKREDFADFSMAVPVPSGLAKS